MREVSGGARPANSGTAPAAFLSACILISAGCGTSAEPARSGTRAEGTESRGEVVFPATNRPDVRGISAAVSAGHPLAAAAGHDVLRRGGQRHGCCDRDGRGPRRGPPPHERRWGRCLRALLRGRDRPSPRGERERARRGAGHPCPVRGTRPGRSAQDRPPLGVRSRCGGRLVGRSGPLRDDATRGAACAGDPLRPQRLPPFLPGSPATSWPGPTRSTTTRGSCTRPLASRRPWAACFAIRRWRPPWNGSPGTARTASIVGSWPSACPRSSKRKAGMFAAPDLAAHTTTWVEPLRGGYEGYTMLVLPAQHPGNRPAPAVRDGQVVRSDGDGAQQRRLPAHPDRDQEARLRGPGPVGSRPRVHRPAPRRPARSRLPGRAGGDGRPWRGGGVSHGRGAGRHGGDGFRRIHPRRLRRHRLPHGCRPVGQRGELDPEPVRRVRIGAPGARNRDRPPQPRRALRPGARSSEHRRARESGPITR